VGILRGAFAAPHFWRMRMSLKEADWTAILNQPKNLGLKGARLGVTAALHKVGEEETKYRTPQRREEKVADGATLRKALLDLKTLCEGAISTHHKVYTTACAHLQHVVTSAMGRVRDLDGELAELHREQVEEEKEEAKRQERIGHRVRLLDRCNKTMIKLHEAHDMEQLHHFWGQFVADVQSGLNEFPRLNEAVNKAKHFHMEPDTHKQDGFAEVKKAYNKLATDVYREI
jgi:hypothetical protein